MPGRPRLATAVIANPSKARRSPRFFAGAGPAGVCAASAGRKRAAPVPAKIGRKPAKPAFPAPAPRQKCRRSRSKRISRNSGAGRPCRSRRQATPAPASLGEESESAARSKRWRTPMPARHQDRNRRQKAHRKRFPAHAGIVEPPATIHEPGPQRLQAKKLAPLFDRVLEWWTLKNEAPGEEGAASRRAGRARMTRG